MAYSRSALSHSWHIVRGTIWCVSDSLYRNVSHFYEHLSFFPMVLDSSKLLLSRLARLVVVSFSPYLFGLPSPFLSLSLSLFFRPFCSEFSVFQLELIFEQSTTHNNIPVCFVLLSLTSLGLNLFLSAVCEKGEKTYIRSPQDDHQADDRREKKYP